MSVVLLGMHRSGTSTATRVINLMGLPLGTGDLVPADDGNPTGHWESVVLGELNDEILHLLGGHWAGPPPLPPGWERDGIVDGIRDRAVEAFRREYQTSAWVWKDPRLCLLLPWWEHVLSIKPVLVFMHRHPSEVAASLASRDHIHPTVGLALWERYVRDALLNCAGRPALFTTYDSLLADPVEWAGEVSRFLQAHGVTTSEQWAESVDAHVDRRFRRSVPKGTNEGLSESQCQLLDAVGGLIGAHDRLVLPELPQQSHLSEVLLHHSALWFREQERLKKDLDRVWQELSIARQRVINVPLLRRRAYGIYQGLQRRS